MGSLRSNHPRRNVPVSEANMGSHPHREILNDFPHRAGTGWEPEHVQGHGGFPKKITHLGLVR